MKTSDDLRRLLISIDHRGYPAYKDTRGKWSYRDYILSIDHVQGDPFASPSNVSVIVPGKTALFPRDYMTPQYRLITLQDMLLRFFSNELRGRDRRRNSDSRGDSDQWHSGRQNSDRRGGGDQWHTGRQSSGGDQWRGREQQSDGSGKSGLIAVSRPGQEVLERTACSVDPASGDITLRFEIGFPANGRSINAQALIRILDDFLPGAVSASLLYRNIDQKKLRAAIELADDQEYIRNELRARGLCAFVGDGSVLPRQSGISSLPMKGAVLFRSPESLTVTLDLPHAGVIRGMGIRRGVTLIVGGGYHGKSTLLGALEKGVYNHIQDDGREFVITDDTAVKVRAEDGRCITDVDISLFIRDLPNGKDTVRFSTQDASGSTSQAANVIEAVGAGSRLLLIDEDTSATNFMVRDELMAQVVSRDKEPITPFISRIRDLYERAGVSTILVAGSSGAFFHIADTVIQMDRYVPQEITAQAKAVVAAFADSGTGLGTGLAAGGSEQAGGHARQAVSGASRVTSCARQATDGVYRAADFRLPSGRRIPAPNTALLRERRVKIKVLSDDSFLVSRDELDLRGLEQLTDREQVASLAHILKYAELHLIDGRLSFDELLDRIDYLLVSKGLEELFDGSTVRCGLAQVRRAEIAGMLNRYRKL